MGRVVLVTDDWNERRTSTHSTASRTGGPWLRIAVLVVLALVVIHWLFPGPGLFGSIGGPGGVGGFLDDLWHDLTGMFRSGPGGLARP